MTQPDEVTKMVAKLRGVPVEGLDMSSVPGSEAYRAAKLVANGDTADNWFRIDAPSFSALEIKNRPKAPMRMPGMKPMGVESLRIL